LFKIFAPNVYRHFVTSVLQDVNLKHVIYKSIYAYLDMC